jgi:hypothetical protein
MCKLNSPEANYKDSSKEDGHNRTLTNKYKIILLIMIILTIIIMKLVTTITI